MNNEILETELDVEDTGRTFNYWVERPFVPAELKESVRRSKVLMVPAERVRDIQGPVFPTGTESLWFYLKEKIPADLNLEVCISDDDYAEYAFHGVIMIIAGFVVTSIAAPVVANLISDYIKGKHQKDAEKTEVRMEMTVEHPDGTAKSIKFKGPAAEFSKFVNLVKHVSSDPGSQRHVD